MDDIEEEDFFSDDGFDSLPANTLLELERNAVHASQQQQTFQHDGLRRKAAAGGSKDIPRESVPSHSTTRQLPPHPPSSDYGDLDATFEDVDADVLYDGDKPVPIGRAEQWHDGQSLPGETTQREEYRVQQYGAPNTRLAAIQTIDDQTTEQPQEFPDEEGYYDEDDTYNGIGEDVQMQDEVLGNAQEQELEALKAQIHELKSEAAELRFQLDTAQSTIFAKTGEIAIVRSKQEKSIRSYEEQLAALRQSAADEIATSKAEIEARAAENNTVADEIRFLKQDLAEESERVRNLQRSLKGKAKAQAASEANPPNNVTLTPKKTKAPSFRDGFDDQEIEMVSPSKSGRKSKKGTPTAGAKRKRKVVHDDPVPMPSLELSQTMELPLRQTQSAEETTNENPVGRRLSREDDNLRFTQKLMDHRPGAHRERIFEVLTGFAFPSDQSTPLSSIVLEKSASLKSENYQSNFTKIFLSLWEQALAEKFYKPMYLFIDIVKFILDLEGSTIGPALAKEIIAVAHKSASINGFVRHQNYPVTSRNFLKKTPKKELSSDVDGTACMAILYATAASCMHKDEHMLLFWQSVPRDFTLMMLSSAQPLADLSISINLLSFSILPTTFGPIASAPENQALDEKYLLERLTILLTEDPRPDEGEADYTRTQICKFRLDILSLLFELAVPSTHPHDHPCHGSALLAHHERALGRLVRVMYDELDALYAHPPDHTLHAAIVNQSTRLVYHAFQLHGDAIDLQAKMASIASGKHKHLVVLTRLAFSEGPLLEAEIEDETVEMAHELLDGIVGPQEADALFEVFPARRDVSMTE